MRCAGTTPGGMAIRVGSAWTAQAHRGAVRLALAACVAIVAACESPATHLAPAPPPTPVVAPVTPQIRCPGGLLCESDALLCGWRVPTACDQRREQTYLCTCRLGGIKRGELREFFSSRYARVQDGAQGALEVEEPQPAVFPGGPAPTAATLRVLGAEGDAERTLVATPAGTSRLDPEPAATRKPIDPG